MNALRKLIADLVDKRLWPVAALLVATAVAVPLLIGGGGDPGSRDADPVALPTAAAVTPAVELVGPPAVRTRPGPLRDPFRRTKKEAAASDSSASSSGSAGSSSKPSTAKATAAKSTGSGSATAKARPATPKATAITTASRAARSAYQTVVSFTRPGGTRKRPLYRLSVLGNASSPALQYLGVGADGEYAIFLLGPRATLSGDDGACVVDVGCRVIGLRKGDKLGVDVAVAGSSSRHYVVEVTGLRRMLMSSASTAKAWRKRVDPIGREVRNTIREDAATDAALSRVRYSTITGTVGLTSAP